jgi:general secretion pathway protein G
MQRLLPVTSQSKSLPAVRGVRDSGLTLVELIVVVAVLAILALTALPLARFQVKRQHEHELRQDLWQMRDAIDRYKATADTGVFMIKVDTFGYPPDLESLTKDIDIKGKKVRFLHRIPVDPMTGRAEWGSRSMQDEPDSTSWGGQNVFDVYSLSQGTAMNGTKYSDW